jgi:cAMP-dependent protein kinase regulator
MDPTLSQAELNAYLQEKNVNTLFVQIVQAMLIEKPDDPVLFTYRYLQSKYPDICEAPALALDSDMTQISAVSATKVHEELKNEEENAYSDTDEDEDEMGEVSIPPLECVKEVSVLTDLRTAS